MRDLVYGPLAELFGHAFYVGLAGALAVVGAVAERASLQSFAAGETTLGLWEAAFGAIVLYAAFNVCYYVLLPRLRGADSV